MTTGSRWMTGLALLSLAAGPMACGNSRPARNPAGYEIVAVTINGHTWQAELADTSERQTLGLGHREHLPEGAAMLFVYDEPDYRTFWMQGTYVPLDIAFIGSDYTIVRIHTMAVEPNHVGGTRYPSGAPAQYALEVPGGTFERLGVAKGDRVEFSQTVLDRWGGS